MATSDALRVVEDWISEHYFTTDATKESFHARVLARRKDWDTQESSVRTRFGAARHLLELELAELYDEHPDPDLNPRVHQRLLELLGFTTGPWQVTGTGPIRRYASPGLTGAAELAVVLANPIEEVDAAFAKDEPTLPETLIGPDGIGDQGTGAKPYTSIARAVSALFTGEDAPAFVLVLAGRWLIIGEQGRWAEGRCLGVDIQLVAERNDTKKGGELDTALTCVEAASLAPDADGNIWWAGALEDSVKHTVGVSKDLREGVRLSIEVIANDVLQRRAAQGLPPLPPDQAQPLALQALRYLYRILFLLFAEASPELQVLPVGAPDYDQGYSLDRLRELVLVELTAPQARQGTHFYDSLDVLFTRVDRGHRPPDPVDGEPDGLTFNALRADLFHPRAIAHLSETRLSNQALQQVLRTLLLSRERRGGERGFISYVDLGINQLGAVYEGLMSYTGSFATDDLYEVAPGGNPEKGSWVLPVDRAADIAENDFVLTEDPDTGEQKKVLHRRGTFVFRLSGRERQQSASYYTPEVLTRFTVSQALAELLDQDGHTTTAAEILGLSVCEPALGSGAFAIEAVRQLAEQYLTRREKELGRRVDPDERPQVLQRIKAHIALHQVHGVDLNATAVELAEISLWLDTMAAGLDAPWFGLRLKRGNSLIGARHAVYTDTDVAKRHWLTTPPTDVPLSLDGESLGSRIHHFLLPAHGWGATADSAEAKKLAPERAKAVKAWARSLQKVPTTTQRTRLKRLAERVEVLWQYAAQRLLIAEQQTSRDVGVWENPLPVGPDRGEIVTREQIEESLADPDGSYQRLKLVMDAWCTLWFWPLTLPAVPDPATGELGEPVQPPTLDQWLDTLEGILGTVQLSAKDRQLARQGQTPLTGHDWADLGTAEQWDRVASGARPISRVADEQPWLDVVRDVAARQGFFHWELEFAPVFGRGGFDLQVGNPPWVRPDTDVDALLAEFDPWWALALKPSEAQRRVRREATLRHSGAPDYLLDGTGETSATATFLGSPVCYPVLSGLRPDMYRCFMSQTWAHATAAGAVGLIHPETHFTEDKAALLREQTYRRLRRHWQFVNELQLFEIHNLVSYGVHVYGAGGAHPRFLNAAGLYHPMTVEPSIERWKRHSTAGPAPGYKDEEGHWDLHPHAERISEVTEDVLRVWRDVLEEPTVPVRQTRMLYTVNAEVAGVLATLARAPRAGALGLRFSGGWNEKTDREKGRFEQQWGEPDSWADAILQGPHLHVNNPAYKIPNPTMKNNKDWSEIDLESLSPTGVPVTAYKPAGDKAVYDAAYTHWNGEPARDHYRVAWRRMAANTGERTLIPALIPPGSAHVDGVVSLAANSVPNLIRIQGVVGSLLSDFSIRASPKGDIRGATLNRLAMPAQGSRLWSEVALRTLRLNCLTDAYADLWRECWDPAYTRDSSVLGDTTVDLGAVGPEWTPETPLRRALDRRQAQVEIDALVALMLGVTADELGTVYRTQFAVLRGYDKDTYLYDANGRLVPQPVLAPWRKQGDRLSVEDRTHTNAAGNTYTYELPFRFHDREADLRTAYAAFQQRLGESPSDG